MPCGRGALALKYEIDCTPDLLADVVRLAITIVSHCFGGIRVSLSPQLVSCLMLPCCTLFGYGITALCRRLLAPFGYSRPRHAGLALPCQFVFPGIVALRRIVRIILRWR